MIILKSYAFSCIRKYFLTNASEIVVYVKKKCDICINIYKKMKEIKIRKATIDDALFLSRGFHMAMLMNDATAEQIELFARCICAREDVLYSWRNSLIAEMPDDDNNMTSVGMLTSYDGRYYHDMRVRTMELIKQYLGIEFKGMEDEAVPGEYYLDSLAVIPESRGMGIGRMLLEKGIEMGRQLQLNVTLAVDPINDNARRLYSSLGFQPSGTMFIFGHDYDKMIIETVNSVNS